jgi:type VI secretion system secreted protein VgrG
MAKFTQAGRLLAVSTPLGTDVLLLRNFSGSESLSRLFHFELDMVAQSTTDIAFDQILGQSVTVAITLPDSSTRFINGIVSRFSQSHRVPSALGTGTLTIYRAELVPLVWTLAKKAQSRIFQQLSVPDILKQVLTGISIDVSQLQGTYLPRDYCVQYHETDFNFACRLMEEEGIYFFFKHTSSSHQMIMGDTPQSHPDVPGPTTVSFDEVAGGTSAEDSVQGWEKSQEIHSGKYRLWDQCFELPGKNFEAIQPTLGTVQAGTVSHSLKVANNDQLEMYEFPGAFAQRFDGIAPGGADRASDIQNIFKDNTRTATIRMQQETAASVTISGSSTCRQFAAGCKFTLDGHFNANGQYVLTSVFHHASVGHAYTTGNDGGEQPYTNTFHCIPFAMPFRPTRSTPRPVIEGTQTAVVVGPSGQEIFTDKYSRVKVQFPWDRLGTNDANSSCWIRVATPWAGQQWGIVHIPRIGQEVVVAFEEGDPDRPIIVGSVYNAQNMPPYTLPDNMTQTGFLSRSTMQGTSDNFNQLRFEEKKGSEEIYFHAEKDFNHVVENNHTLQVGQSKQDNGDQTVTIFNNRTINVGDQKAADGSQSTTIFNNDALTVGNSNSPEGSQTITIYKDRTETVQTGNETVTISKGNRSVTISEGNESLSVVQGTRSDTVYGNDSLEIQNGNRAVKIDMGNDSLEISMGNQTTKLDLGSMSTQAMQSITLTVGQSSITINQQGVTIQGMTVSINGQIQAQVQGAMVQVSGSAMTQISGGITMIG